jgi:hypothetical protein
LLKATQINHQLLADKHKALKIEHAEMGASRKPKTARAGRGSLTGEAKEISHAGGRFSVVGEPWVELATMRIPFPRDVDPMNPSRYNDKDPGIEQRGIIAELYLDLAPHLQLALADPDRQDTFTTGVSFMLSLCIRFVSDQST